MIDGGLFVCFKQKTAYEMRISDWSSDVCSSDLRRSHSRGVRRRTADATTTVLSRAPPPPASSPLRILAAAAASFHHPCPVLLNATATCPPPLAWLPSWPMLRSVGAGSPARSEEHTPNLPALKRSSYLMLF